MGFFVLSMVGMTGAGATGSEVTEALVMLVFFSENLVLDELFVLSSAPGLRLTSELSILLMILRGCASFLTMSVELLRVLLEGFGLVLRSMRGMRGWEGDGGRPRKSSSVGLIGDSMGDGDGAGDWRNSNSTS